MAANTLYHYRVKSRDAAGNLAMSGDFTFTTAAAADTTTPIVSNILAGGVAPYTEITPTQIGISWDTNEASDTQVEYGATTAYGNSTTLNPALVTGHSATLTALTPNTLYHYRVKSRDAAGNLTLSADLTFTTPRPADATRANAYDDAWQNGPSGWLANVTSILSTPVGITKTPGKVLHVGDSMTRSMAYGEWARNGGAWRTASDVSTINQIFGGLWNDNRNGWYLSAIDVTALERDAVGQRRGGSDSQ